MQCQCVHVYCVVRDCARRPAFETYNKTYESILTPKAWVICATIEVPRNVNVAVGHCGSLGLPGSKSSVSYIVFQVNNYLSCVANLLA